jgi:hypothetical protein
MARIAVRAVDLEFAVDKIALGRLSLGTLQSFPVSYQSTKVPHLFYCYPGMGNVPLRSRSFTQTQSDRIQRIKKALTQFH